MQGSLFNSGVELRDRGIKQATDHADRVEPGWSDRAFEFMVRFLNQHSGPFMAEDVRSFAAIEDFELPPSNRAWGGVLVRAKNKKLIRYLGTRQVRNPKAHCANAALWQKV